MTKTELRQFYLERRKKLSGTEKRLKETQIAARFFARFDLSGVNFLHCFLPIEKFVEIDTRLILEKIWRDFPRVETLLPRVDRETNRIDNLRFHSATKLIRNAWQIDEPTGGELVASEAIDLVLVPLLCFDRRGFRVGYGKGFYDRFLKDCRADCLKIGLSFFPPETAITDIDLHDVRLDYCVTPEQIFVSEVDRH